MNELEESLEQMIPELPPELQEPEKLYHNRKFQIGLIAGIIGGILIDMYIINKIRRPGFYGW